jgi:Asp-tRNA(Asn)/Glu-tRNA(Gln) amidotransferase A subunit family amidase
MPAKRNSALVSLLLAGGAIPFVKTGIPITLLSFESNNAVFGPVLNPHSTRHSPGGSTGGEAALLAYGGSRVGIGSDVAGSVRVPSHYSGVYTIRSSVGRFPKWGGATSVPGQEGVPPIVAPMTRTLEDLEFFWKAVVGMEPWKWDHSVSGFQQLVKTLLCNENTVPIYAMAERQPRSQEASIRCYVG